jgi:uncharacterized SAM-binding protein YcdF (DUF218 family)
MLPRPTGRRLAGVAALAAAAFLVAGEAGMPARWLLTRVPVENPDAIVSLASHEWERLPATAELARQYPAARVLLTVPMVITEKNCHECYDRVARLTAMGVPDERIQVLPRRAQNTYEEALSVRQYAASSGARRILVVTSPYHTRRTLASFRAVFNDVPGAAIGVTPASGAVATRWWLRQYDRHYVRYELLALLWYRIKYGVPLG